MPEGQGHLCVAADIHDASPYPYESKSSDLLRDYFLTATQVEENVMAGKAPGLSAGRFAHREKLTGVMINISKSNLSASPKTAGYSPKHSIPDIASAWQEYCNDPESKEICEHLGGLLEALLNSRLPKGRYKGILLGMEEEVRQDAYLLLARRYLGGNPELIDATLAGDLATIRAQIALSAGASISAVSMTLKNRLRRYLHLHDSRADLDRTPEAICIHPAGLQSLWDLPFEQQRDIVFAALGVAVRKKLLRARNAKIAMDTRPLPKALAPVLKPYRDRQGLRT